MAKPLIGEELKQIEKSNGGSINHWVGGLVYITVQNCYDIQYLTMRLSGYMNAPIEPDFFALKHGMEYLIHHTHEPIMYLRKKIYKTHKSPTNVTSNQGMHKSSKNSNNPTFSTHILMQIIPEIYLEYEQLHQHFIS